jgi:PAS domain S-box-containing protein
VFGFDSMPIPALLLELDGTIVAANGAARRLAGLPGEELVGHKLFELAPDLAWPVLLEKARRFGEAIDETVYQPPTGPQRTLQFMLSIVEGDRPIVQAFAIDITARKAAEDAARARADAEQADAAEQRLESLGLVAGGIAHDFNNLLVGVLAEASAAREDHNLAETTRDSLRRIEASARRMAQLTRQLLAYSGRAQFATVPVRADELVGELREQLARLMPAATMLAIEPMAGVAVVEADPGLLRQIVVNLVTNAAEAGGKRISLQTRTISRDGAPWWQLEVTDNGAGIATATLSRMFEPFFTTKAGHHGLGLSAVHGVVRRLNGDVEVDSLPGQGARFRVHLPILPNTEPAPRHSTDTLPSIPRLTGLRVLVVDDEPSVRATVRRLLERRGATVVVASDGIEAEARLRDEQFTLVVSDVSMPGPSGYDVLLVARATQPTIRVVLMSGYTERLRGQGGEDEPDAFLEKPFTAKALDATIDEVLKGKR